MMEPVVKLRGSCRARGSASHRAGRAAGDPAPGRGPPGRAFFSGGITAVATAAASHVPRGRSSTESCRRSVPKRTPRGDRANRRPRARTAVIRARAGARAPDGRQLGADRATAGRQAGAVRARRRGPGGAAGGRPTGRIDGSRHADL